MMTSARLVMTSSKYWKWRQMTSRRRILTKILRNVSLHHILLLSKYGVNRTSSSRFMVIYVIWGPNMGNIGNFGHKSFENDAKWRHGVGFWPKFQETFYFIISYFPPNMKSIGQVLGPKVEILSIFAIFATFGTPVIIFFENDVRWRHDVGFWPKFQETFPFIISYVCPTMESIRQVLAVLWSFT